MPKTVLVVDDDTDIRSLLTVALEQCGVTVATRSNGRECLQYLRTEPLPAAILLDVRMPDMDGLSVLETAHEEFESVPPVVLLTGTREPTADANVPAVADVLRKPFGIGDVETCLERVLDD